jgi:hypothetical protein
LRTGWFSASFIPFHNAAVLCVKPHYGVMRLEALWGYASRSIAEFSTLTVAALGDAYPSALGDAYLCGP